MRNTASLLFVFLCAVMLGACDRPDVPASSPGASVAESKNAAGQPGATVPVAAEKKADAGQTAASAVVPHPMAKADGKMVSVAEGLALAQKNHCLECHSIDKKIIGPAWMDVSKRYKGVEGIEDRLVVKVSTGGYGNWGNMPMPALAPDVKEKDIRTLVRFVLSLAK